MSNVMVYSGVYDGMAIPDVNDGSEMTTQYPDNQEPDDDSGPHQADADSHDGI